MKKTVLVSVILLGIISMGAAQSYTLTDADSNLTDTKLTADFTGLPADTQLTLESLGDDTTELATFTSTSSGTATVSWRHNPFEDGTALISDGWTYRIRDDAGTFNYEFEVLHGNMLSALDTFNDGTVDTNISDIQDNTQSCSIGNQLTESNGQQQILYSTDSGTNYGCYYVIKPDLTVNNVYNIDANINDGRVNFQAVRNGNLIDGAVWDRCNINPNVNGDIDFYLDEDSQDVVAVDDSGNSVTIASYTDPANISIRFALRKDNTYAGSNCNTDITVNEFSISSKLSRHAWKEPNRFDVGNQLLFGNFLANQATGTGLEFSNETLEWSVTPPESGTELNYRITGSETLGSVAVDSYQALESLTFNPITPSNNSNTIIQDGSTVDEEFVWEILYSPPTDQRRDLTVAWILEDRDTGETIEDAVYASPTLEESESVYYEEFRRTVNDLPAGNYKWQVQFYDNDIDASRFYNMYFSYTESSNAPVDFELRQPSEGSVVNLTDGTYPFKYSVNADNSGELSLKIPQYENKVRYSESINAGNTTREVVLNLANDVSYDWYLEYFRPESTTTTGDDGIDGFEDGDLSEYSGSTGDWAVTENAALKGTFGLEPDAFNIGLIQRQTNELPTNLTVTTRPVNVNTRYIAGWEVYDQGKGYTVDFAAIRVDGADILSDLNGDTPLVSGYSDGTTYKITFANVDYSACTVGSTYVNGSQVTTGYSFSCDGSSKNGIVELQGYDADFDIDQLSYTINTESTTTTSAETFKSRTISFQTAENQTDSEDGDNDTTEPSSPSDFIDGNQVDVPGLYYFLADNNLGIDGSAADYLAGGLISIGLGLLLGAAVGSAALGGIGIIFGMLISGLVGLVPGWIVFMFAVITGYILAKLGVFGE